MRRHGPPCWTSQQNYHRRTVRICRCQTPLAQAGTSQRDELCGILRCRVRLAMTPAVSPTSTMIDRKGRDLQRSTQPTQGSQTNYSSLDTLVSLPRELNKVTKERKLKEERNKHDLELQAHRDLHDRQFEIIRARYMDEVRFAQRTDYNMPSTITSTTPTMVRSGTPHASLYPSASQRQPMRSGL